MSRVDEYKGCKKKITTEGEEDPLPEIKMHIMEEHYINGSIFYLHYYNKKREKSYETFRKGDWVISANTPQPDAWGKMKVLQQELPLVKVAIQDSKLICQCCGREVADHDPKMTHTDEKAKMLKHIKQHHMLPIVFETTQKGRFLGITGEDNLIKLPSPNMSRKFTKPKAAVIFDHIKQRSAAIQPNRSNHKESKDKPKPNQATDAINNSKEVQQ